jgi:hypothetical protein
MGTGVVCSVERPKGGYLIFTNDVVTYVPTGTRGGDLFRYTLCHENGGVSYYDFFVTLQIATFNPSYLVMSAGRESLLPSYPFTFEGTSLTAHGSLARTASGETTYTPNAGFEGVDQITYATTDEGTGTPTTNTVDIVVGSGGSSDSGFNPGSGLGFERQWLR